MSETSVIEDAARVAAAPFVHRIRIGWGDCDPARIAYTGRLPCFALEAIDAWWERHVGLDWFRFNIDRGVGTPFVHLDLDFRSPVTPRAPLDCTVALVRLGESSTGFRVEGRQDGVLCFAGNFVSVFVDADSFVRMPVPDPIRAAIEPLMAAGHD